MDTTICDLPTSLSNITLLIEICGNSTADSCFSSKSNAFVHHNDYIDCVREDISPL